MRPYTRPTLMSVAALLWAAWISVTLIGAVQAGELLVGAATVSITPDKPVPLSGQMHTRIARQVESPLLATAVALESREDGKPVDQAVMVSCDVVVIPDNVMEKLRARLKGGPAGLDPAKVFLSATHTHTAPVMEEDKYELPKEGIVQPAEFVEFLVQRVAEAVTKAWQSRQPGAVAWGLGHAVVAQNRRAVYADGHAQMYGATNVPQFRGIEGGEDHGIEVLFFFGPDQKPLALAVNVSCTAQEVEGRSAVNADFFHEVRGELGKRFGKDIHVLGWIGAAGDQSPHLMYRKQAEERMRQLRGLTRLEEIARRIVRGVDEAYEGAAKDIRSDAPLVHRVQEVKLPVRKVTDAELANAKAKVEALSKDPKQRRIMLWHQEVVNRYETQKENPFHTVRLHVVRLGDVVIATNPFELFTDYGVQIKARSPAVQTFVVQLVGPGGYLPTERAVRGGGYSAIVESSLVGPEGGQVLVDRTVEMINSLWPAKKP